MFFSTLIFLCSVVAVPARLTANEWLYKQSQENENPNTIFFQGFSNDCENVQALYEQKLDHFSSFGRKTFKQRHWYNECYSKEKHEEKTNTLSSYLQKSLVRLSGTPPKNNDRMILLYICGEGECFPPAINDQSTSLLARLAREYNAAVFTLEHRFYGDSTPTEDWTTYNLKHLTHYQALADLADYIENFIFNKFDRKTTKVYTVGGSYPGALSAWMRYKYPHLVHGSLASSGVVNAISDFQKFDYQIAMSAKAHGEDCYQIIGKAQEYLDNLYFATTDMVAEQIELDRIKRTFGKDGLEMPNDEFAWFFADTIVMKFQYGAGSSFCAGLVESWVADGGVKFDTSSIHVWKYLADLGVSKPSDYSVKSLKNSTIDIPKNMRQWTWQYCTMFGWLQTPYEQFALKMRSDLLTMDFWKKYCVAIFPEIEGEIFPKAQDVNNLLGGNELTATRVIYSNGAEDPWQWATKRKPENAQQFTLNSTCPDNGHCVDLGSEKDTDCDTLKTLRKKIISQFGEWHKVARNKV